MQTTHRRLISSSVLVFVTALIVGSGGGGTAYARQAPDEPLTPETWTITPSLGFAFGGDLEGAGLGLGVAAGYNYNTQLRFEGDFAIIPSVEQGVLAEIDTTIWTLTANVLYAFETEGPTFPYLVGGIGVGRGTTDLDELDPLLEVLGLDESSTEFVFNIGGGVNYQLNNRTSVRGDLRYSTGDGLVSDFLRLFAGVTFNLGRTVP